MGSIVEYLQVVRHGVVMADTEQVAVLAEQAEELKVEDVAEVKESSEEGEAEIAAEETESGPVGEDTEDATAAPEQGKENAGDETEAIEESTEEAAEESEEKSQEE